ncbi:MAG: endonuclease/exonuclease/phosphatase family protein [Clostridia bacterium]|nr:endonuclease/exonuclease/phosphatase family protein [Clostridia bacterium]
MNFKRLTAIFVLVLMMLSLFTGCKSNVPDEEEAVTDMIVESEKQEMSGDAPEKVEPGNTDNEQDNETPDVSAPDNKEPEKEDNTPSADNKEETPNNKEPEKEDNTPSTDNEATTPDDNGGETEEPAEGAIPEDVDEGNFLKIVAYNIRYTDDGQGKDIVDRAPRFKKLMDQVQPDIMGLSEATPKWIDFLEKNVVGSKYKMLYTYRNPKNQEAQPLLFDQTKFELLDDGYFWLSETPEVSSKSWCGQYYRGATWAKLKVKATGKVFLYYSTHLSGGEAAVKSAQLITKHAKEQGGFDKLPVFCTGDFNVQLWSGGYTEFVKSFNDVNDFLGFNSATTTGGYSDESGNHIIDYVMASPDNIVPTHYEVLPHKMDGGYISDHRGLYVEAYLK